MLGADSSRGVGSCSPSCMCVFWLSKVVLHAVVRLCFVGVGLLGSV